jgi:hypothetical protein
MNTQVGQYGKETVSSGDFMEAVFRAGKFFRFLPARFLLFSVGNDRKSPE